MPPESDFEDDYPVDDDDYRLEVEELTELMRKDAAWDDLRDILRAKGFDPNHVLLASYYEDDDHNEYGVLVTADERVIEFERFTDADTSDAQSFAATDITGTQKIDDEYPQVQFAFEMLRKGTSR